MQLKRRVSLMAACAAVVAAAAVSHAQAGMGMAPKMETIEGVLVDTKCYGMMPNENAGNDHMVDVKMDGKMSKVPACAAACATMGIPVALKQGNKTLVLAAPASQLSKHMAETVKVMGMYSKDKATFIVMKVIPKNGEAYDIHTMM